MIMDCCWDDYGRLLGRLWEVIGMIVECYWDNYGRLLG